MIDFATLYDKHIDNLFAFGSKFTQDREMIKDCIQDVFVRLYSRREMLESVNNIDSYLYVALRNRINDEFRRNAHNCDSEINDSTMKTMAESDAYNKEKLHREHVLTLCLERAICKLSPRQRQIIDLYYVEKRKYDEICRIMGINYQSVRNLMHRSISRLRVFTAKTELSL